MKGFTKKTVITLTILTGLVTTSIAKAEEKILARVNNETITTKDLEEAISTLPPQFRAVVSEDSELKKKLLDRLIEERLLIQEMKRAGVKEDEEIRRKVERFREALLLEKFLKDKFSNATATDDEIKSYYENHKEEFKQPEIYELSYISIKDEQKLKKAVEELKKGTPFEEVAKKYSEDEETKNKGGYLGEVSVDGISDPFKNIISRLKPGEFTEPIKSENGYQIIKVIDKKPARILNLGEVREKIKDKLTSEKQQKEYEKFIKELKARSRIEVAE
ncbi:MAG: peptidylprolyl isomerase [Thermosulfidibacteraceae bacterium]